MWRRLVRSWCAGAWLLSALLSARAGRAQATAEEKAAAEAVFEDGLRLIKQGKFAEACPKFEMSQRVEPGVGTMLYLAECYEKTNRTASSWAMFREAASLAETSGQTERMKMAQARAARLEPRLAWLNIEVSKGALVPGLSLKRNGVTVAADLAGTPTPVDPGEVLVEASAPGRIPFSTKVAITAKAHVVVTVPTLPPVADPPPAVPAPPRPAPEPAHVAESPPPAALTPSPERAPPPPAKSSGRSLVPWIVGGAGIVGLGVGGYFGLKAMSNADDARAGCPNGLCNEKAGQTAASDARTDAKISNVAFALGGVALATSVVLYFTLPTQTETQVGLSTLAGPSSLGLSLRGRLSL